MKTIQLVNTDLSVSRFVFGTGSLHHLGELKAQIAHLQAAADAGFSHFDTAPLYGFGQAERALGQAFGGKSIFGKGITMTTKVGLYPPGGTSQSRATMLGRKLLGKAIPAASRAQAEWTIRRAQSSLDESLRRLRRDFVELLLLHEPDYALIKTDEWLGWLDKEVGRRVMHFGICGSTPRLRPFVQDGNDLAKVLQAPDSVSDQQADELAGHGCFPQLTYGYLSSASDRKRSQSVLRAALSRNQAGAILVSTRERSRLFGFSDLSDSVSSQ